MCLLDIASPGRGSLIWLKSLISIVINGVTWGPLINGQILMGDWGYFTLLIRVISYKL